MSPDGNTPRVLVSETIADAGIALLREAGIDVDVRTDLDAAALLREIGNYEGLLVRSATKVTHEVIDAATKLQVVGRAGIGVDNVDVDAATRRGIVVANAPQGNILSTAEHTIGLLLALARKIPQAHALLTSGTWDKKSFMGIELHDKTLGIVGLGRVGTLVAQRMHAFGMHVIARDPYLAPQRASRIGIELVDFDELLERADMITIHSVKTPETVHMFAEPEFERCKPGVLIVNASRGGLIDEEALAVAIKSGKVGGAALDVFETEPTTSSPLFDLDNVVVTPHLAGSTAEAQDKAGIIAAQQVLLALRGEFVPNAVNLDAGGEIPDFLRPFLALATKLGRLNAALAGEAVSEIEISYLGPIAEEDTRVLSLSALRGFLQAGVHEPVTYVNAPIIAADRGIQYAEKRTATSADYTNLIRVEAQREDRSVTVAGTITGRKGEQHLVEVDGRPLDIVLTPFMAFFRYEDRPGVVHRISGPLADAGINIKNMYVAEPDEEGQDAILVLSVDRAVPAGVLQEMITAADIASGRFVSLDGD